MEPTLGTAICLDKSPCGKVVLSHIQVKEHQTRQLEIAPAAMQAVRDLKLEDSESQASLGCKTGPCNTNQSINQIKRACRQSEGYLWLLCLLHL